jgi:hypothetical protein
MVFAALPRHNRLAILIPALIAILLCLNTAPVIGQTASSSGTQVYPNRIIRMILPFPVGAPSDIVGRAIAQKLAEQFGVAVVPDNRVGAGGNLGIGFAVPVSTATQIMDSLIKEGKVTRGWIGVEPRPLNAELAESFGIAKDKTSGELPKGVLINGVLQNSPAAKAGILPGDLVMQVGGRGVSDVPEMLSQVAALKPGEAANIGLLRSGKALELKVVPGVRPPKN